MSARGLLVSGEGKGRGANVIKEAEKILGGGRRAWVILHEFTVAYYTVTKQSQQLFI